MRLSEHQSLILRTGHAPVKAGQFIWHREQGMNNLTLKTPFTPVLNLKSSIFVHNPAAPNLNLA
jgi:type IV secretion system protein VirD4